MITRTLYAATNETNKNMVGAILLPKGNGRGQEVKFFDAVEWGVPVEFINKKKVIDQDVFTKLLEKHMVDGKDLSEHTFKNCVFDMVSFAGLSLYNLVFDNCQFLNCDFYGTRFNDVLLYSCELCDCNISNSSFYSHAKECHFENCDFTKTVLGGAHFDECVFDKCCFLIANMRNCSFFKCNLKSPNFVAATMNTVYFRGCKIDNALHDGLNVTMGGATTSEVEHHRDLIMAALS